MGFWFCLAVLGPEHIGPDGQPAGYAAAAAAGFGIFVAGCVANICLETHSFTLIQAAAVAGGLAAAAAAHAVCGVQPRGCGGMVDYGAPAAAARSPAVQLLAPVAVVAALLPAVAFRCFRELRAPGPLELARQRGARPAGPRASSPLCDEDGGEHGARLLARIP